MKNIYENIYYFESIFSFQIVITLAKKISSIAKFYVEYFNNAFYEKKI